ncbi:sialate O-acetylesterase [Ferruginibacter sp.]|nr:sialate O-acetylesterase [Ferruginibacter sp.]
MKKIAFLICLTILSICSFAKIYLPAVYSNHMVLQQQSKIKIWGWSDPAENITIKPSWDTTTYFAKATSGAKWETVINTPKAGGTFAITVKGNNNSIIIEDVLIGEIWLASGQSNMEMNVNWGMKYDEEVKNAANNQIRFFHIPKTTSIFPLEDVRAEWVVCTAETMKIFSTAAYFFGKKINEQLNVPVGLISACWGGTPAEVWTPEDIILNDKILKEAAAKLKAFDWWPSTPAYAYNAMIAPLTKFKIAGAIWYQGESNTETAATYQQLFTAMISAWRKKWDNDFPFYFVQIAPYSYGNNNICALLREAQTKSIALAKTGMVVTSDLVDNINDIHPKLKKEVGERLANYALADNYGKTNIVFKSPLYKSMQVEKNKIRISFSEADKGLMLKGTAATDFFIAGADKIFFPAMVKLEGNTVVVFNKDIKAPVAVRFGFSNTAMPNLFSADGLPVNLFRTDDWEVDTSPVKK